MKQEAPELIKERPLLKNPKNEDEERDTPDRKYSVLEDEKRKGLLENGQKIETF